MEVWVAKTESWDGSRILGVYSTESLASEALEKHMASCDVPGEKAITPFNAIIKFNLDQESNSISYLVGSGNEILSITQMTQDVEE